MRNRIVVHLSGGLGNQMFQFMAGYGFAKESGRQLAINLNWFSNPRFLDRNNAAYLTKRKPEILEFSEIANSIIDNSKTPKDERFERLIRNFSESSRRRFGIASEVSFGDMGWSNQNTIRRLSGYFMAPKYFLGSSPKVPFMKVLHPSSTWAVLMTQKIEERKSIGVHIRLGDYLSLGDKVVPSEEYYLKGVSQLKAKLDIDASVFLFTDEPDRLAELFPLLTRIGEIISPPASISAVENLVVLSKCSAFVCSNSTFSWWGATLGDVQKNLITRPSYFYSASPDIDLARELWSSESIRIHPLSGRIMQNEL
jgi:hypothetical protein